MTTAEAADEARPPSPVPQSPDLRFRSPISESRIPSPESSPVSYRGACRSLPVHSAGVLSKPVRSTARTAICGSRALPVGRRRRRCAVRRPPRRVSLVGRAVRGRAPRPPRVMLPRSSARHVLIPSPGRTSGAGGVSGRSIATDPTFRAPAAVCWRRCPLQRTCDPICSFCTSG